MQLGERLIGLALVLAGLGVIALLRLLSQLGSSLLLQPAPPPGLPPGSAALLNPFACLIPILALGALGLIVLGLKRVVSPDS